MIIAYNVKAVKFRHSSVQSFSVVYISLKQARKKEGEKRKKSKETTKTLLQWWNETFKHFKIILFVSWRRRGLSVGGGKISSSSGKIGIFGLVKGIAQAFVLNDFPDTIADGSRTANLLTELIAAFLSSFLTEAPRNAWEALSQ